MRNSVSDQSFVMESDDEEHQLGGSEEEEEEESDGSSSCGSPRVAEPAGGGHPGSYASHQWPQSYRQSMDIYSSVQSPSLSGFLGTPTLSRLSSSFLAASFRGKPPPEIVKPLLPTAVPAADSDDDRVDDARKSSHQYLPPVRKASSLFKIPEDKKPLVVGGGGGHEVGPYRQCSYTQGVMNGVNVLCGVGILSTPYAVRQGGWLGLVILAVLAVLAWYTGVLLRRCLDSKEGLETYPDIGHAAFGTPGRIVISIILYMELYACCVEYLILESDNLSKLFPDAHLTVGGFNLDAHVLFAILTTLVVMPTTWLRDLSCLSFISAGGVVASIVIVACLFWAGLVDHVGVNKSEGTALNLPGIPIAIGLYGYCYSGHGVFPNIYSSLKKSNQFNAVLFTCIALSTVLFAGAAVMGYIMFGETTESQFTLNMPPNLMSSKIAVWTTVTNPITKYALTMTPLALSLEELLPPNRQTYRNIIMLRSALVLSSLVVALSVPFFGLVMSLVGSLLTMFVAYILPCACFLAILRSKVTWYQIVLCVFIIVVGLCCAGVGTYSSLSKIIQNYQ
ncbi:amino acid transporter AVT1C-like [Hordeum vulgare subsp. vulgare]|uniref:Amino acid transporter transmembrane domain-containing protein n=2 Tax=Hordeum vulgare TaxID=4513 RepID=A0A8I7B1Z9_HORVV|nr:amino acid transporter AVT1C-like [Hordeum vulgare subsp. vulgare]